MIETHRDSPQKPWTYAQLDAYQRKIAKNIQQQTNTPGVLILSEVAPVITLGHRIRKNTNLFGPLPVYPTDRGGLETYHGPGQWLIFPVDHLTNLTGDSIGVRLVVHGLLEIALELGKSYNSKAEIKKNGSATGCWLPQGKYASVGIHIEKGILLHGLAINIFQTQNSFLGIRPCGLDASPAYLLGTANIQEFLNIRDKLQKWTLQKFWQ